MNNNCNNYRAGIDIGSTTVKLAICDNSGKMFFSRYYRHNAVILDTVLHILKEAHEQIGDIQLELAVTGSAGMGVAESFDIPFVQEIVTSAKLIKTYYPEVKTLIEIGGEDSKIVFFDNCSSPDIRMNGSCAGGTGAFIDQMAVLLDVSVADLDQLAGKSTSIYPIASRCGVFAKTDIQALLSNKVSREDIAASIFHAVAFQVISTLARGSNISGKVLLAGGPLKFFPQLQKAFADLLNLDKEKDIVIPEHPEYIPAIGAALNPLPGNSRNKYNRNFNIKIQELIELLSADKVEMSRAFEADRLPPLFRDSEEFQIWQKKHAGHNVKKVSISRIKNRKCFLGIDSGSTTTKIVLIDDQKKVALTYYASNNGDSIYAVQKGLREFQKEFKRAGIMPNIAGTAVTGYGEDLIKAAFGMDRGVVETIAHFRAARSFDKNVSFILDIGGQDMKAIYINNGAISDIQVNEACSSGCGSFIETFAHSLGYNVSEFAELACRKNAPFDLGTRCTVFMNSKVKQALREGASVSDISAGLAYSVIKNSLYKVLRLKDSGTLGRKIVVQGGAFQNPAVLRAFEILIGKEVIRPNISELMGAYGAALTAHQNYQADSTVATRFSWFDSFDRKVTFSTKKILCSGCENKCAVKRLIFKNGESYFTGNRCDRYFSNGYFAKEYRENLVVTKLKLLFDQKMKPDKDPILTFGIPRVLNMYENFPFWCAFLVECGFKVVLSDVSSLGLCEKGLDTVMSDNICFPAKLVHGHIVNLIEKGVDQIFYPSVVYENQECRDAENSFNCPIVTGYPDVIRSSIDPKGKYGIPLNCLVVSFKDVSLLKKQLYSFAKQFGVSRRRVYKAIDKGITAHKEYKNRLNEMAVNIINKAKKNNRLLIVLAGRPYHIDPLVNHGISELLAGMGADLIPEDVLPNEGKYTLRDSNVLTQWSYTNRLFAAAKYVAKTAHTELVHITSFGCGLDAISADEAKEIITNAGKIYTLIKMDEITNLGAVRIRLRSTLEAIKETKNKRKTKSFMPKKQEKTIIIPWVSPLYSPLIPFLENTFNQRLELLPPQDSVSVDIGLKYVNNDMCYPAVIIIGDIIKALQSGKYDPENTSVMLTQTGGQCRASNYVFLTKKGLIKAGFSNVSVLSLSLDNSISQPELTINKNGFVKRAGMGVIFTDALAGMHFATVAREVNSGESKKVHEKYLSRMGTGIEKANFKYLLNLLREAISEFNGINIKTESVPVIGVVGEIFVKYNSFSNNNIIEWLISQGIEVVIPSFTSFFTQRFINEEFDQTAYLKCSLTDRLYMRTLNKYTQYYLSKVEKVMQDFRHYRKPHDLRTLAEITSKITSLVNKAGEGWLLTAEMIAMLEDGIENIVCLQPFGCLSNHITGNGLERKLKTQYPRFNLLSINMDPGASEVNILNRLHFMVAAAKEDISKLAVNRNIPVDFGAEYYKNKFPKCAGQMPVS